MPINGVSTGATNYDIEVLVKAKEQQQVEGQAQVRMIEEARVQSEGPEQRRIKHPNSTLSVIA